MASGTLSTAQDTVSVGTTGNDSSALFSLTGTFSEANIAFEASRDGSTWFKLTAVRMDRVSESYERIRLFDNEDSLWAIPLLGMARARIRLTAIASGSISVACWTSDDTVQPVQQPMWSPEITTSLGGRPGTHFWNKFGHNPDVDALSAPEDLWNGGGLYTGFPETSGETLTLTSSSTDDSAAGTGMRTCTVYGLDENWLFQTETVTLNGTVGVTTTKLWTRVYWVYGVTAGAGGTNAGAITVRHSTTTANIFAVMPVGNGGTQIATYTVPADRWAVITRYGASASKSTGAEGEVLVGLTLHRVGSGLYRTTRKVFVGTGSAVSVEAKGGIPLAPKTDVVLRCLSATVDNVAVVGSFDICEDSNVIFTFTE